ncbi:MAG: energy-coupling factor transporter transmembrane protein EcfT [Clostridiales bacterium]|nr:energy-coupling factor transporter transmembrane protein EcfT [Clostridiales bacterium]
MKRLDSMNPIAVSALYLCAALIPLVKTDPVLACLFASGALLNLLLYCGQKGGHGFSLLLFFGIALLNPLVSHKGVTVLFVMNHNPITLEALLYGVFTGGIVLASLYWFRTYSHLMTSDKLLYLFGALSPKLSLVLSMALRYVPLFGQQIKKVQQAQTACGLYREDNLPDRFRGGMRIFSVMITWALENGITTADSMTARGYGLQKRSRFSLFKWTAGDIVLLCASLLLCVCSLLLLQNHTFTFYPVLHMTSPNPLVTLGYICYTLLILLPAIIHVKEVLRWRCLTSGM